MTLHAALPTSPDRNRLVVISEVWKAEGGKVVVLMTMDVPVRREDAEAVTAAIGLNEPPKGLIAHVITNMPDGVHVVDIWESREDFQKFADERLIPTTQQVMAERGISMDPIPQPRFEEGFDLLRGR